MYASRITFVVAIAALATSLTLVGCDEKKTPAENAAAAAGKPGGPGNILDRAKDAGGKAMDAAADAWKSVRDEAVKTSERALASTKSTLDSAGEKIAKLPEAAQAAAKTSLDSAKTQYDAAAAKLTELKNSDGSTWTAISTSVKEMVTKLGDATKNLTDKLK